MNEKERINAKININECENTDLKNNNLFSLNEINSILNNT